MEIFDQSFKQSPRNYLIQALLAMVFLSVILYFVEFLTQAAIVVALGSSTFIVFAMPRSITAQPRRLIGGHLVGIIVGAACYYLLLGGSSSDQGEFATIIVYAFSVGLSLLIMTITNTEHPPAAGTALGLAAYGWSWGTVTFIILCAVGLSIVRRLLRPFLRDLI
jgi:CBS-domain-containing membrane protein